MRASLSVIYTKPLSDSLETKKQKALFKTQVFKIKDCRNAAQHFYPESLCLWEETWSYFKNSLQRCLRILMM